MRLRTAINEYKRARGGRFPGEASTTVGALSGYGGRLVHVAPTGQLRDYSLALSGLHGVDQSRFGIEADGETRWFDELETVRQHYYDRTCLVETEYDAGAFTIHQYDLTLDHTHLTHVELRGRVPTDARLVAFLRLAPDGQESRIGRLIHEAAGPDDTPAVEVFHRREHDYVTASTGLETVQGQLPERFPELLDEAPLEFPRSATPGPYEDTHLSGDLVVTAPLEREGRAFRTTLLTRLADHVNTDRERTLAVLRERASAHDSAESLRATARDRAAIGDRIDDATPRADLVRADRRVFDLLEAPSGARIAAPDFDPFYVGSGGYGYTWFREDAEVSTRLLGTADRLDLDVAGKLRASARFYCSTQLADGSWPHRVWPVDGSLAPGWANAAIERDPAADDEAGPASAEYQADQTATVTRYLARLLRERRDHLPEDLVADVQDALAAAVNALDARRGPSDLPGPCQNLWEDATGQFTHTAATFIQAYAAVARAPVARRLAARAREGAEAVFDALDVLWDPDHDRYARGFRGTDGVGADATGAGSAPDPAGAAAPASTADLRLDAGTFALVEAFEAYATLPDNELDEDALDRLSEHVSATLDGLFRNPTDSAVAGLIRYEGDRWRRADQAAPKIWSVATAWGAAATARLGVLFEGYGRDGQAYLSRAADLYELIDADGPLATPMGYLAEQAFDDGTHDGATPLGRSHAYRLQATAILADQGALPTATAAPAGPAERPRWTTGEKYGLGTAADHDAADPSRVWFTLTAGALTELRFPRVDLMNLRTLDFLVRDADADGDADAEAAPGHRYTVRTHNETRRDDAADTVERRVEPVADDALLFRQVITETGDGQGRAWTLTVEYATDPDHDAVVADVQFRAEDDHEYDVFAVANAALANTATDDRGLRLGEAGRYHLAARAPDAYTGETEAPLLVDEDGDGYSPAIALTATDRFDWATVGVAGSDRLQALFTEGRLPEPCDRIDRENVVLIGRLGTGRQVSQPVAIGCARRSDTAGALGEAAGALARDYETIREAYADTWRSYLADKPLPEAAATPALAAQYRTALMSLVAVEDKTFRGASVASPSVPWGEAVTAEESRGYGYNFVWARDLYQVFTVALAVGDIERAIAQLEYVYAYQQDENGFIPQNTYLNGSTRWGGEQMDNISFPQVMAYQLYAAGYDFETVGYEYANVRRSANYVARHGPSSGQERWEEESGYSPSTIAAEIAGLACAAKLAIETGNEADALIWLGLADRWANRVEDWTATESGSEHHTETPYYVRVTRDGDPETGHLRTLANDGPTLDERDVIDAGFLELVRLGIKPPMDRVIRNSLAEVDATIRVPVAPTAAFYRYNGDGYGERARGDPGGPWSAQGSGKGRLWPLLTGERAEYELTARAVAGDGDGNAGTGATADEGGDDGATAVDRAGDRDDDGVDAEDPAELTDGGARDGRTAERSPSPIEPQPALRTMAGFANSGRMLPEQVWDRKDATSYNWQFGKGTGSATPLAWSMAQYVRLAHGIDAGTPVETPTFVRERYRERELNRQDRSPALRVDTRFEGDHIAVIGETTGAVVAMKTATDIAIVEPEDGAFEQRLDIDYGENHVIVAAATDHDLERSGTTVTRRTL